MNERFRGALRCLLAFGLTVGLAPAHAVALFVVTEPWVRVAPNARSAEAYMQLRSTEGATVVGVRSDVSADVAIRSPGITRGAVPGIRLPAGETVLLAPGALRLTLTRLSRPLKLGDRVPIVLTIESPDGSRQEIPVDAEVRRRSPTDDHRMLHRHAAALAPWSCTRPPPGQFDAALDMLGGVGA
ncbi:MAG: copper chaperone PCu(A)C [Casimicrobiaceae bacterium]